ncbi:glycosyltransferase family 2 protein [Microtetraspora malaysiensis]|uniref:glycosyltransferase family 2 protein n=1 Tax=Microtetraspora malaysiensis TaxID=161358 RepID=UPI0008327F20|nr:glycosyltransferase family A protein [Microtetraspora malaysiensis]
MSEERPPSVAAVICTRGDRAELLREAVESIVRQDYPGRITVMVVHDRVAPEESLTELAAGPAREVRVMLSDRQAGLPASRNAGVLATDSDLVGFCDDDDAWLPGKLSAQVAELARRPDAGSVACGAVSLHDGWTSECVWGKPEITFADLLRSRVKEAPPSSFLMRRDVLLGPAGLFSEEIPGGFAEDYEMLLRLAAHAPVAYVRQVGVRIRVHGRTSHFTGNWAVIAEALEWLLREYPDFAGVRRGHARIAGQIALSKGMLGQRREALRWASRAFRASPLEIRSYVAAAMALHAVSRSWVLARLAAAGATS